MIKKINYKIISIDNRSESLIERNKNILKNSNFEESKEFNFIDGRLVDAVKILKDKNISLEGWNPWDYRTHYNIMSTEAAIWLNNIEIYKYITENQIDHFLIIEDDTIFVDEFRTFFKKIFREIPRSYDFISLINVHIEEPHTQNKVGINTKINNKYLIHKSDNQYSHFNCILISKKGAKKILDFLYQHGIYYTVDCQIFDMSRRGILEGYSIRPDSRFVLGEIVDLGSIIDPENKRHNLADIKEKKIEK